MSRVRAIGALLGAAVCLLAIPGAASAATKEVDCNADGEWFRTDSFYAYQSNGTVYVSEARLLLEGNDSNQNNALYHVRGEANNRTYYSYRSGDDFPGTHTIPISVDTTAPRNQRIYVQGYINADQTIDSQCWTPRGYLG
jgi:hypothetical protein